MKISWFHDKESLFDSNSEGLPHKGDIVHVRDGRNGYKKTAYKVRDAYHSVTLNNIGIGMLDLKTKTPEERLEEISEQVAKHLDGHVFKIKGATDDPSVDYASHRGEVILERIYE